MRRGGSLVPSWGGRLGSRTRPRVNAAAALSSSGVGPHPTPLFTSSTLSSCRHLSASNRLRQDWKIDEEVDDYKDVYASDEDIERKYQKAPIEVFGKPGEIASTWYSTALVMNALEAVESDLKWLLKSKDSIPSFAQFLEIKTLPKDQMKKILQGALKGAGFHRLTQKLLVQNLIDEGELHLAPEIAAKFLDIMRAHRKEVDVTLTFASLPDKVFMENVMARIQKYKLRDGQQPVWKFKIDPELLGGYRASAPHLFTYDFTVKAQNDQMKEWLKNFEEHVARDAPAPPAVRY